MEAFGRTHQVVVDGLLAALAVGPLQLGGLKGVRDVEGAGVEAAVLVGVVQRRRVLVLVVLQLMAVEVRPDAEGLGVEGAPTTAANLLIHVGGRPRYIERGTDAHSRAIQMAGADLGHVAAAVNFLVLLSVLVVVVRLERELGATYCALEAAAVEEGEVLERTDAVHLVDRLLAAQTAALVEVHAIHGCGVTHLLSRRPYWH